MRLHASFRYASHPVHKSSSGHHGTRYSDVWRLSTLGSIVTLDAALGTTLGVQPDRLGHQDVVLLKKSTMDILFKHGVLLDVLEFGLEVNQAGFVATAIGAATTIGEGEARVLHFLAFDAPVRGLVYGHWDHGGDAYQPPLPAPFFLVFFGSVSIWPDLAK